MESLLAAAPAQVLGPLSGGDAYEDLAAHVERYGPRPVATGPAGTALIDTLDAIGLTGRGGAHFPAATKWRTIRDTGRPAVVVANAAEGEPASAKDRALLASRPHLVLDGLFLAAETLHATDLIIWTHDADHATRRSLHRALAERSRAGYREQTVQLAAAPPGYLSGESSAIIRGLSGGPVLPRYTREPAARHGLHGHPTLIHNVETLARTALAARTGTAGHHPTVLLTVHIGRVHRVLEMAPEHTVADAVRDAGWPSTVERPAAVLLGGYGGTWLPWHQAAHLPLHEPTLRQHGTGLGAGILIPLPAGTCALAETAAVAAYLAANTAHQCGPCHRGLPATAKLLDALADGRATPRDLDRLATYLREIPGRGACHHPDGAVRFVTTALTAFHHEVAAHLRGTVCPTRHRPRLLPTTREPR